MSFNSEQSISKNKKPQEISTQKKGYQFGWNEERNIQDQGRINLLSKESMEELMRSTMEVTLPDQAYEPENTKTILSNGLEDVKKSSGKFKTKVDSKEARKKIRQSHADSLSVYTNSSLARYFAGGNKINVDNNAEGVNEEGKASVKVRAYQFIKKGNIYEKALGSNIIIDEKETFNNKDYAKALDNFLDLKVNLNITSANSFAKNAGYLKWLSDYYASMNTFLSDISVDQWQNIAGVSKYRKQGVEAIKYALDKKKEYVKTVIDYYNAETALINDPSYIENAGKSPVSLNKNSSNKARNYSVNKHKADAALAALLQKSRRFGTKGGYTFEKMNADAGRMIKLWESMTSGPDHKMADEDDELLFFKAHSYLLDRVAHRIENLNTGYKESLIPILTRYNKFNKLPDKSLSQKRKVLDNVLRNNMEENSLYKPMDGNDPDDLDVKIMSKAGHIGMDNVRQYFLRNRNRKGVFHSKGHTAFLAKAVFNQPEYIQKIAYYILEKGYEGGVGESNEILKNALSPAYIPNIEKIKDKSMVASKFYIHKRASGSEIYWNNLSAAIRRAKSICSAPSGDNSTAIKEYWKNRKRAGNPKGNEDPQQENVNAIKSSQINININPNNPDEENILINTDKKEIQQQNNKSTGNQIGQLSKDFVNKFNTYADFVENKKNNEGNLAQEDEIQAQKLLEDAITSTTAFFNTLKEVREGDIGSIKDGLETANKFIKENRRYLNVANKIATLSDLDTGGFLQGNAKTVSLNVTGVITSAAGLIFSCMSLHKSKATMFMSEVLQKAIVDIGLDSIGATTDSVTTFINAFANAELLGKIGGVGGTVSGGASIISGGINVIRGFSRKSKSTSAKKTLYEQHAFEGNAQEKKYNNTYDIQQKINKDKIVDGVANICSGTAFLIGGLGSMATSGLITSGFLASAALGPVTAIIASGIIIGKMGYDYKRKRDRIRNVIDHYINIDRLVDAYKNSDEAENPLPKDNEIKDMLRRQAAANAGCADMEDFFNYICEDYAKNLYDSYLNATDKIKQAYRDSIESLGINTKKRFTASTIAGKLKG